MRQCALLLRQASVSVGFRHPTLTRMPLARLLFRLAGDTPQLIPALLMRGRAGQYAGRMSDSDPHHRIDLLRKEMETVQAKYEGALERNNAAFERIWADMARRDSLIFGALVAVAALVVGATMLMIGIS